MTLARILFARFLLKAARGLSEAAARLAGW
jgi:hypothetical protein